MVRMIPSMLVVPSATLSKAACRMLSMPWAKAFSWIWRADLRMAMQWRILG